MKYPLTLAFSIFAIISFAVTAVHGKDVWTRVQSKNFLLVGNAPEKDIRRVGEKLEQFRESFRIIFGGMNLTSPIPTNVVVFKSDSAYKPFKPKRSDGKVSEWIAGYFQPGEDVNYITLSTEGDEKETFGTIFHEYVHSIIDTNFGRSQVPQWFNEGLAEYYQTFEIENNIKVKIGLPQAGHLQLLQQNKLLPLDQLLKVSNYQLREAGDHSRSIFYAQSWALVHYLIQGGKVTALGSYLNAVTSGTDEKAAFEKAFQTTYAKMESELRNYVSKSSYQYSETTFKNKLEFDTAMQTSPVGEALSNAYLGDLLYHTNRADDAESFLAAAVSADPDSSIANIALGMVKTKQRKFDAARQYFERAMRSDPGNHLPFYQYAYLLSREGRDEFGFVQRFESGTASKIRDALRRAIEKNPSFGESYELFGFVSLVNNEELDQAAAYLKTALKYQPGNQRYLLRLAEIGARQKKFDEARAIVQKVVDAADDEPTRTRASGLLTQIGEQIDFERRQQEAAKHHQPSTGDGIPRLMKKIESVPEPTLEEMAKMQELAKLQGMNEGLRKLGDGEVRLLGRLEKIDCRKRPITFTVKTGGETFALTSKDFTGLALSSLSEDAANAEVGCDAKTGAFDAVITYKAGTDPKSPVRGELIAVEFVPSDFRFLSKEEMVPAAVVVYDLPGTKPSAAPAPVSPAELESKRRDMVINAVKAALQVPKDGEKRVLGFLDKIECSDSAATFAVRTDSGPVRLKTVPTSQPRIVMFVQDLEGLALGCGQKAVEYPAYFIYTDKPDAKAKIAGEIRSVEFLPKTFAP